ncbi:hypothetical protein L2E82_07533 [Cichorium intybus]|uniref:Uncharacterized protein n=1 Tax=Cichorium intybus TaxID=13427 RepID=A0ACB9G5I9_CICIN|nr:hypothetical protein L2E82_07533 [Cichorium intybus]
MGSPERVKASVKRDIEDSSGSRSDRARDNEISESDERRKRRSNKSRQSGSGDEYEGLENSGRKRRPSGSSKAVNEEDEYESRKESRAKQMKKKQEESALETLSNWYQDGEGDSRHDGGERNERRKSTSKVQEKGRDERLHDGDLEKLHEKDSKSSQKKEISREKSQRKRWDDANIVSNVEESNEVNESKTRGIDGNSDKVVKHHERSEKNKSKEDVEVHEEDNQENPSNEDKEKIDDEDGRGKKDIDHATRRHHETEYKEKDGYKEERSKGRDENWKRRQDKEKDGDAPYDYTRDWESPSQRRGGRDRVDPERHTGRPGGRKDGNRTDAVKTSSNYGISKDNYDVIEIETKPFSYTREDKSDNNNNRSSDLKSQTNDEFDQSGEDGQQVNLQFNRNVTQGVKVNRMGRGVGGRVRPSGSQQVNLQIPMMGSPFGPLGMPPPGGLQPLTPSMSPGPGPMSPAVFIPPFSPPVMWPGAPAGGPPGPRFPPNITTPNSPMFFNQPRGMPPNVPGTGFNPLGPMGRGQDKGPPGWVPPRNNGPPGKAPSRGEQNDYSQNFVDTGMRPQNFIRELELTSVVEDYPKLRELIQKKDEIVANSASAPMYYKCDLHEQVLSPEFFGTKFDVILVDPPWEEYVHRAPGVTDHMEYWTFEEIMNLKIEAIADTPSFVFLWVGDGVGLEQGRQCLKKWGFRRCEDICWVKTNKTTATPGLRHDSHTLFQRSKEHCLMGIKGTVRRSTDGHIIHANIDTDVIIAEEPPYGSTAKPEDMYRIIEHFSLGRRRLELFGEDHNIRSGWLTVGKDLSSSNFNAEGYVRNFADKDGKVWQGGGGRNPPPEAGHLVLTTPDIEALRPKSPMKNQLQMQQQQQQSNSISLTGGNSGKRPTGNSPGNHGGPGMMNQEASGSNMSGPVGPWGPPMGPDERFFDNMYGYNGPFGPMGGGEFMDFETHRAMNNML